MSFTFWLRWKASKEWQELQSPHREKPPQQSIAASSLNYACKETCPKWTKKKCWRLVFDSAVWVLASVSTTKWRSIWKMLRFLCVHRSQTLQRKTTTLAYFVVLETQLTHDVLVCILYYLTWIIDAIISSAIQTLGYIKTFLLMPHIYLAWIQKFLFIKNTLRIKTLKLVTQFKN